MKLFAPLILALVAFSNSAFAASFYCSTSDKDGNEVRFVLDKSKKYIIQETGKADEGSLSGEYNLVAKYAVQELEFTKFGKIHVVAFADSYSTEMSEKLVIDANFIPGRGGRNDFYSGLATIYTAIAAPEAKYGVTCNILK